LDEQLREGLERLGPDALAIAYLQDHTATYLDPSTLDGVLLTIGRHPRIISTAIGTRPDCLPTPVLDVLASHAARTELLVEVGLQSANDRTLRLVRRGHTVACFTDAVRRLHSRDLRVCAHVILGLPTVGSRGLTREGAQDASATARLLASLDVEAVKLHNCHVLAGTPLADLFLAGLFQPPDLDEYVDLLAPFLEHLPWAVEVHRLVGEARPPALLAPAFTARKAQALQHIRRALGERGAFQGRLA